MKGKSPHRLYIIVLAVFSVVFLGIIFGPQLLYGAVLESEVEDRAESVLKQYAEGVPSAASQ